MLERIFHEPKFRVCCLGAVKLVESGSRTDMTPASRKTRALIGYLCIVGKPVGRERLASLLWGERGDEQARASLRQTIYELRSLLGGDRLLKVERDTVAVGDDVRTDVAEILAAAQSGDLEQLRLNLSEWRGDFFEDLPSVDPSFDAWLQSERPRVRESLVAAATEAATAGMAKGEIDAARKIVGLLQQHDAMNEVVLRLALRLDDLAGDSAALHRRYERFRDLLRSELAAAPAAETRRLFDELAAKSSAPELPAASSNGCIAEETGNGARQPGEKSPATPVQSFVAQGSSGADTETRPAPSAVRTGQWFKLAAALFVIVSLCALIWSVRSRLFETAPSRPEPLLAVMPFQDLGGDLSSQGFSFRISKEIADALRRTTKVGVAPPPSSLHLPDPGTPAATHVLSGSVERRGNRLHVIAQLMDIADDRVVWGHAYDEAISQTPAHGQDIAALIAGALGKLLASNRFGTAPMGSAAYDHYLRGRNLFRHNDPRGAAAELEASIGAAPGFANAWATLAAARLQLAADTHDPSMAGAARVAAQRATALDPDNGEALGVRAMLIPAAHLIEIDGQFDRALRAEPDNTQLLAWHGEFLMYVGRSHEALDELKRAYILDRTTPGVVPNLVLAALRAGQLDEAKEILDTIDAGRDNRSQFALSNFRMKYFLYRRNWFGLANYLNTMPDRLSPRMAGFLRLCRETATAFATHETGRLGQLHADWRSEAAVDPDDATQFLSALGDYEGALATVEGAVKSGRNDMLLSDPQWEALFVSDLLALRRDPRFPALLAQWGLSDYWRATNHLSDYMR